MPRLPSSDRIAHLLLALRTDETGFVTVANLAFSGAGWRVRRRLRAGGRPALDAAIGGSRAARPRDHGAKGTLYLRANVRFSRARRSSCHDFSHTILEGPAGRRPASDPGRRRRRRRSGGIAWPSCASILARPTRETRYEHLKRVYE